MTDKPGKVAGGNVTLLSGVNTKLPNEVLNFRVYDKSSHNKYPQFTADEWTAALYGVEVRDKNQQITLRPWFAAGVFLLLMVQNIGVWFIVVWALNKGQLENLELIFSTLISGSLVQSYFILRFITEKVFSDIDYRHSKKEQEIE